MTVTGMPLSAPLPDGSSMNVGGDSTLAFTPGEPFAIDILVPSLPWPQPCGIDTTPGMIASVTSTGTSMRPQAEVTVSSEEAGRWMDGGHSVDGVAMPADIFAWLGDYVEKNYRPQPEQRIKPRSFIHPKDRR